MSPDFNYNSMRSKKARLTVKISPIIRNMLKLIEISFFVIGIIMIVASEPIGWLLIGVAFIPLMILWWWNGELHRLEPIASSNKIEDLLASNILGRLKPQPTSEEIAKIAASVSGGRFLLMRFGIGAQALESLATLTQNSPENIWQTSIELKNLLDTKTISGGVIALAIIKNYPDHERLLAQFNLESDDLKYGVRWHDHIFSLINKQKEPKKTGGIARDWSFGFTPILDRFGRTITPSNTMSGDLEQHHDLVEKMVEQFSSDGRKNIALIGPDGTGKTTVVNAFAEKIADGNNKISSKLQFHQVVLLDASALISAAPGRGELEGLINTILVEAYSAKNIIICLDNAQLFFEEGVGSVDLSNVLLPIIEAGNLRMILTIDEHRFLQISARNPSLANSLNRLQVKPANYEETLAVMQDKLLYFEHQYKVVYMFQALKTAYNLSQRYIFDLEMPGRAVKLLEMASGFAKNGVVNTISVEEAIEQTMNVKISTASTNDEREKLLNLENMIHQRMIDQEQAVSAVANALRRARAGVRNQNRPIGTFLFLGPTGVGKTELAKALAEVYFNGEDNLIRLDLNEYVNIDDVNRLIADAADDPRSLTAQVMKKPFSVVLIDEIEKAHPNVLTALLQVLDEGILRDIKNREVSFRDTIIIATSNAGADKIREIVERGYDISKYEDSIVNNLISTNQFRPEFLNRFDEITIFKPLSESDLLQVVDLMIAGVNKTLASQKIKVSIMDDAKRILVSAGYDPRLGARPMRRIIQKVVENTVAKKMLSGEAAAGSEIIITADIVQDIVGN
jgi:ATP-dependent Clp protease ATP-binding subunit ClpC